jgi:hypothetical protein
MIFGGRENDGDYIGQLQQASWMLTAGPAGADVKNIIPNN